MPSTHFHCPHCNQLLQKSDPDYILGEAGGSFISFGDPERRCPVCRKSIERLKIIRGEYDPKPSSGGGWIVLVIIVVIILWALSQ